MNVSFLMYSVYYQAYIEKKRTWLFAAVLRGQEHLVFDRTYDPLRGLFEFFVPKDSEHQFLAIMHVFEQLGIVSNLVKQSNPYTI